MFLEISQNLQENTCARGFFLINLQASALHTSAFFTKHLWATASISYKLIFHRNLHITDPHFYFLLALRATLIILNVFISFITFKA